MHQNFNIIFLAESKSSGEIFREEVGLWSALRELSRSHPFLLALEGFPSPEDYFNSLPVSGMEGTSSERETDPRYTRQYPCIFVNVSRALLELDVENCKREGFFSLNFGGNYDSSASGNYLEVSLVFQRRIDIFRGLGVLIGLMTATPSMSISSNVASAVRKSFSFPLSQETYLQDIGFMMDCSRNAVATVSTLYMMIRYCALVGINTLLLYMEDTYQLEKYGHFGMLRGAYSYDELKAIDDYADAFGIKVIPCIQTLGHMGQILQWSGAFSAVTDTSEILLANEKETYRLVEQMIESVASPFRSKIVHIGMDETVGIGSGAYKGNLKNNQRELFRDHLYKVAEICKAKNIRPLIWSDMLFCSDTSRPTYYDSPTCTLPLDPKVVEGLGLVYWNYYHTSSSTYEESLEAHTRVFAKKDGSIVTYPDCNIWMASGLWSWNRLWSANQFSMLANDACMKAVRRKGHLVKHVFTTAWGDDGNECNLLSILPGLFHWAELAYLAKDGDVDKESLSYRLWAVTGVRFDQYVAAGALDNPLGIVGGKQHSPGNASKWLLWQDPIRPLFEPCYRHRIKTIIDFYDLLSETFFAHYSSSQRQNGFDTTMSTTMDRSENLLFPALVAIVIALKLRLREQLGRCKGYWKEVKRNLSKFQKDNPNGGMEIEVYPQNSNLSFISAWETFRTEITGLQGQILEPLIKRLKSLHSLHRKLWLTWYKATGWDILEIRYGGQITRLTSLHDRIKGSLRRFEGLSLAGIRPGSNTNQQRILSVMSVDDSGQPATTVNAPIPSAMSVDSTVEDQLEGIDEIIGGIDWRERELLLGLPSTDSQNIQSNTAITSNTNTATSRSWNRASLFVFLDEWEDTSGDDDWPAVILTDEHSLSYSVIEYSRAVTHQRMLGSR